MSILTGSFALIVNIFYVGVILIGVPWALFTIGHTRRATDDILVVQREILRQLRRTATDPPAEAPPRDDVVRPPKQPFW
jgi:hypothetical protein